MEKPIHRGRLIGTLKLNERKLNRAMLDEDTREGARWTPAAPYLGLMDSMEQQKEQMDLLVRAGE